MVTLKSLVPLLFNNFKFVILHNSNCKNLKINLKYIFIVLNNNIYGFRSYKTVVPARKQARLDSNRMEIDEPEFNILKGISLIF